MPHLDYDYVVIGSGFGGSVAALRLAEKGYKVLVIEKGKHLTGQDFPKSNWNLKKWLWLPALRFFGPFQMTFLRHVMIMSGVGVGGGSLVYANTLPIPGKDFFQADSWAHLADWENELKDFYQASLRMLGATPNPHLQVGDKALLELAKQIGKEERFETTNVSVYFGEPDVTVPDPYFNGEGPSRVGCNLCGACLLGCRYDAKNSLDRNYLYFAQKNGARIQAEKEVCDVRPLDKQDGSSGYTVKWRSSTGWPKKNMGVYSCRGVIFAGGVLGTVGLLLNLNRASLPRLSDRVGYGVRTNSESLVGITALDRRTVFSEGVAINSILHTGENSNIEPVHYPAGSGFWRVLAWPAAHGNNLGIRLAKVVFDLMRHPVRNLKVVFVDDWAKRTQILLFMQTADSSLRLIRGRLGLKTSVDGGSKPTAFIPEAMELANRYSAIVNGKPCSLMTETLLGKPTTAHVLGGCVMGDGIETGVIDKDNHVFGYENMFVCDGSMISANPGVNPALTIMALTERAMSKIPDKTQR